MRQWTIAGIFFCTLWTASCNRVAYDPGEYWDGMKSPQVDLGSIMIEPPQVPDGHPQCSGPGAVKVAILVETAGSMQFADPHPAIRQSAVKALVDRYQAQPHVSFAIIRFNSRVRVNGDDPGDDEFTRDPAVLANAVGGLLEADLWSDHQGALNALKGLIEADMAQTSEDALQNTRYVAVVITDGGPSFVCQEGCNNDFIFGDKPAGSGECTGGSCGVPDMNLLNYCDMPRERWCDEMNLSQDLCAEAEHWFVGLLAPCQAYNGRAELLDSVGQLKALEAEYGAGQVELHTRRVLDVSLPEEIALIMAINPAEDAQLLKDMAHAGGGSFRDSLQEPIDLSTLDLASVGCAP